MRYPERCNCTHPSEGPGAQLGYPAMLGRLDGLRTLGVDLGLGRVREVLARLGSPEACVPALQIAGSNGKGSTAAMAESILRAAGLRTGLFTSPHLARFTERIRVSGREADGDRLAALDRRVQATGARLTYFEVSALLAFLLFAEEGVEVAVIETGLGGRLDAATVCRAVATAVTTISIEHADILGSTLGAIAREKAGIARAAVPLLLGPLPPEADAVIAEVARGVGAPIRRFGPDFGPPDAPTALPGSHQRVNAALAVELARAAAADLCRPLSAAHVAEGLAAVRWPGRLERIANVVLDCAHNIEGAAALAAAVSVMPRPRALCISMVRGKDAAAFLGTLAPHFDQLIATRSGSARALPAEDLGRLRPGARVVPVPSDALSAARAAVGQEGFVVVTGSIFLVGEIRALLTGEPTDPIRTSDPL